jgi:hypothetical protein
MTEITNKEQAIATAKMNVESARAFLHRLAKHLEDNGMPGQAGNCTLHALNLQKTGVCLAFAERD